MNEIVRDNGFRSRKLLFSLFSVAVIFVAWLIAGHVSTLVPMYDALVGGVLGIAGMYLTGSIVNTYVGTKVPPSPPPAKPKVGQTEAELKARLPDAD